MWRLLAIAPIFLLVSGQKPLPDDLPDKYTEALHFVNFLHSQIEILEEKSEVPSGEFLKIKDGVTILDAYQHESGDTLLPVFGPTYNETTTQRKELCADDHYQVLIDDAIQRAMDFYDAHITMLREPDHALGLAMLKVIDSKHDGSLQKQYPIDKWIDQICSGIGRKQATEICFAVVRAIEMQRDSKKPWISPDVLEKSVRNYVDIGHEEEIAWSVLNANCLEALVVRCTVPKVCEKFMFDDVPSTQFHLAGQIMHRMFAEASDCLKDKSKYVKPSVVTELCAKMYREAELIAKADIAAPISHFRDLFSEQIAFCGVSGFPNFFRADFLDRILSWQSKSDYGCFTQTKTTKFAFSDKPVARKLTKKELEKGITAPSGEYCQPHLTSVSTVALAMYRKYMKDNC